MDWKKIAPHRRHHEAGGELLEQYGVDTSLTGEDLLEEVARVFSRLPYENLTKLIRKHREHGGPSRFRLPSDVVGEHLGQGAGGTCFSLSCLFGVSLAALGVSSYPVLAQMRSRRAMHCGLVVPLGDERFLLDPGYLVFRPLRLQPTGRTEGVAGAGKVALIGEREGDAYHLESGGRWRYSFRDRPMTVEAFLKLWDESFNWPMMNNIHLSRAVEGGFLYARGHKVRRNLRGETSNENIRPRHTEALEEYFQISRSLAEEALRIVAESRGAGRVALRSKDEVEH